MCQLSVCTCTVCTCTVCIYVPFIVCMYVINIGKRNTQRCMYMSLCPCIVSVCLLTVCVCVCLKGKLESRVKYPESNSRSTTMGLHVGCGFLPVPLGTRQPYPNTL